MDHYYWQAVWKARVFGCWLETATGKLPQKWERQKGKRTQRKIVLAKKAPKKGEPEITGRKLHITDRDLNCSTWAKGHERKVLVLTEFEMFIRGRMRRQKTVQESTFCSILQKPSSRTWRWAGYERSSFKAVT